MGKVEEKRFTFSAGRGKELFDEGVRGSVWLVGCKDEFRQTQKLNKKNMGGPYVLRQGMNTYHQIELGFFFRIKRASRAVTLRSRQ